TRNVRFTDSPITDYHNFLKGLYIGQQCNVQYRLVSYGNFFSYISNKGDDQNGVLRRFDSVPACYIGNRSVVCSFNENRCTRQGGAVFICDHAGHFASLNEDFHVLASLPGLILFKDPNAVVNLLE